MYVEVSDLWRSANMLGLSERLIFRRLPCLAGPVLPTM